MQTYWHKMNSHCNKCDEPLTLMAVLYSADGQMKLEWVCIKCAKECFTIQTLVECVTIAYRADLEQSFFEPTEAT